MNQHYVIVRCRDAGVHCGVLQNNTGRTVELTEARRIWSWKDRLTLNEIANHGVGRGSRVAERVKQIRLLEACEIIECTEEAEGNLRGATWTS